MEISNGVLSAAKETYNPCNGFSFKEYVEALQKIQNEFRAESELERIRAFMKNKWFLI